MTSTVKICLVCAGLILIGLLSGCRIQGPPPIEGFVYEDMVGLHVLTDGTTRELVTWSSLGAVDCSPFALAADGQTVAYSRTGSDLWVTDLATGQTSEVVHGALRDQYAGIGMLRWSPDQTWLAVLVAAMYDRPHNRPMPEVVTLFVLNVKDQQVIELASGVGDIAWLSDGRLAYLNTAGPGARGVYIAEPASATQQLLYENVILEPALDVSPRDDLLVVSLAGSLLMINPQDGMVVDLLQDKGFKRAPGWPVWSPDGTQIAFVSCVPLPDDPPLSCTLTLFVVQIEERTVEQITFGEHITSHIAWSTQGDSIAFGQSPTHLIYRVSLADKTVTSWPEANYCGHLLRWP